MLVCIGITFVVLIAICVILKLLGIPGGVMLFFIPAAIVIDILILHRVPGRAEGSGMLDVMMGDNKPVGRWREGRDDCTGPVDPRRE